MMNEDEPQGLTHAERRRLAEWCGVEYPVMEDGWCVFLRCVRRVLYGLVIIAATAIAIYLLMTQYG